MAKVPAKSIQSPNSQIPNKSEQNPNISQIPNLTYLRMPNYHGRSSQLPPLGGGSQSNLVSHSASQKKGKKTLWNNYLTKPASLKLHKGKAKRRRLKTREEKASPAPGAGAGADKKSPKATSAYEESKSQKSHKAEEWTSGTTLPNKSPNEGKETTQETKEQTNAAATAVDDDKDKSRDGAVKEGESESLMGKGNENEREREKEKEKEIKGKHVQKEGQGQGQGEGQRADGNKDREGVNNPTPQQDATNIPNKE